MGRSLVRYLRKMSPAATRSGRSILIFTSSRPGRRIAGSIRSGRVEAPMTTTLRRPSTPSSSVRNWGTIVVSTSEEMPVPRVRKSASISSKKTTTGTSSAAFSFAFWKISRIFLSVSPTYLLSSSGPLTFRKYPLIFSPRFVESLSARLLATALAIIVLPHPGERRHRSRVRAPPEGSSRLSVVISERWSRICCEGYAERRDARETLGRGGAVRAGHLVGAHRQRELKDSAVRHMCGRPEPSAGGLHDRAAYRQPHAHPLRLGCVKGVG